MSDTQIWYSDRDASAFWLMMLLVAITCPLMGGLTRVVALPMEVREVVEVKAVEPESWLARIWDMVEALLWEDEEAGKTGAVLVLKSAGAKAMAA